MANGERSGQSEGPDIGVPPPGFRLPAATRPGTVTLQVADLDRSLGFYQGLLGFGVIDRSDDMARLGAHGSGGEPDGGSVLLELRERPGARPVAPRSRLGLFHTAVLLPSSADFGRFLRHAVSKGIAVGASDHAVSEAVYLSDPDGLGLEVYRDRPRSEWRARDGELVMTTEPLAAAGAMAAADGAWDGMPAGTRIGHIHLHVGALEEASAFYHDGLGLDRVVWSYPGALFLSAGGYHHHLGLNTWARGAVAPGDDEARLLEWSLVVPDDASLDALIASFRDAGFDARLDDDGLRTADPWGTPLRVAPAPGD